MNSNIMDIDAISKGTNDDVNILIGFTNNKVKITPKKKSPIS